MKDVKWKNKAKEAIANHCPKCGCLDIDVLKDGTVICHNKFCLSINKLEEEKIK